MFNWSYAKFSLRAHGNESTEIIVTLEIVKKSFVKRQLNNFINYLEIDKPTKDALGITGKITLHESKNKEIYLSVPNQHSKENNLPFLLQTYFICNHERISAVTMNEPPVSLIPRRKSTRIVPKKNTNSEIFTTAKKSKTVKKIKRKPTPQSSDKSKCSSKKFKTEPAEFSFSKNLETFWKSQQLLPFQAIPNKDKDALDLSTSLLPRNLFRM